MRILTEPEHLLPGFNEHLKIAVVDEPGEGGACHRYDIIGFTVTQNPSRRVEGHVDTEEIERLCILFQNGPLKESKANGVSDEALLVVIIDRLRSFCSVPVPLRENRRALMHLEMALMYLQKRAKDRMARGVEGTNQQ